MKKFFFILISIILTTPLFAETVFFFPQVADGADFGIRFQTTIILINNAADTTVEIEFFNSDGSPLEVTLGDLGTDSQFSVELKSGESFSAQTPGTNPPLQVGYARIRSEGAGVGGTAVFTRADLNSGTVLYEAGVPATSTLSDFTIFVDSLGVKDTGIAIVIPPVANGGGVQENGTTDLTLTLYDKAFNEIATTDVLLLEQGTHMAKFVREFFSGNPGVVAIAEEMEGTLAVSSSASPIAAVTVRQNDDPTLEFPDEVAVLTTFPVQPGTAAQVAASSTAFLMSNGKIAVLLDLRPEPRLVETVLYRIVEEKTILGEFEMELEPGQQHLHILPGSVQVEGVSGLIGVQFQLIYADGAISNRLNLSL